MVCDKVTEVNIRLFLKGDLRSCFWLQKKLDTLPIPLTSTTYSSMNNSQNLQPLLNVAVRQCICLGLLQIDFSTQKIPGSSPDIVKSLVLTEKGRHFLNSQETVKVPEQVQTFKKIHPNRRVNKSGKYESNINFTDSIEAPPEPTKRNMLQRIVWMIDQEFVEPVSSEDQVKFLGYFHDYKKLLYIENTYDFSEYEAVRSDQNFIWSFLQLKKGKGMIPAQRVVRIKGETMDVIVHRNKCAGVRACAQTGCSTSYPIAYAS